MRDTGRFALGRQRPMYWKSKFNEATKVYIYIDNIVKNINAQEGHDPIAVLVIQYLKPANYGDIVFAQWGSRQHIWGR